MSLFSVLIANAQYKCHWVDWRKTGRERKDLPGLHQRKWWKSYIWSRETLLSVVRENDSWHTRQMCSQLEERRTCCTLLPSWTNWQTSEGISDEVTINIYCYRWISTVLRIRQSKTFSSLCLMGADKSAAIHRGGRYREINFFVALFWLQAVMGINGFFALWQVAGLSE